MGARPRELFGEFKKEVSWMWLLLGKAKGPIGAEAAEKGKTDEG